MKTDENNPLVCEFCETEGFKETADMIKEKGHYSEPTALSLLFPDEKWICNRCLRIKLKDNQIAHK